jgi:hypothetical protein
MGFKMSIQYESYGNLFKLHLRGNMTYQVDLGTDAFGNITRINNALADLPKRLEGAQSQLDNLLIQQEAAKSELAKPFTLADELAEKEARLALLNADLNIDGDGGFDVMNDTDSRDEAEPEIDGDEYERQPYSAKSTKPPILDAIRSYNSEKPPSVPGKKTSEIDI